MKWTARHLVIFAVVLFALAVLGRIAAEYRAAPELRRSIAELELQQELLERNAALQLEQAGASAGGLPSLPPAALRQRLDTVRRSIAALEGPRSSRSAIVMNLARGDASVMVAELSADFRLKLLRREDAAILAALGMIEHRSAVRSLQARRTSLAAREAGLERRIAALERRYPVLSRAERVPLLRDLSGPWRDLIDARRALTDVRAERSRVARAEKVAERNYRQALVLANRARAAMVAVPVPSQELQRMIEEMQLELAQHWSTRAWEAVQPMLWWALWVTVCVILVPPAVKAFWFFVVAPVATRLRPVVVDPELASAEAVSGGEQPDSGSGVSRSVALRPGEELIVRPEYLQSSMRQGRIDSTPLLSRAIPLGSLATGLVGLTRVRVDQPASATVSASDSVLDEIALIEIAAGASIVFKPRNLIGVVQPIDCPVRIESFWRFGHLSAWLTLQLRFLVFRGPCVLVVKGARGVVVEPAAAGRRIAGAATLGWSAGLAYSLRRSETFLAYLTGKQSLFNDSFEGPGRVIYEEMPTGSRKGGLLGRGLEGLGDGLLKVVGL